MRLPPRSPLFPYTTLFRSTIWRSPPRSSESRPPSPSTCPTASNPMETNINIGNIGSSQAFRLQRAILIYGTAEHRSGFATVHEVQRPSAEANPRLGPATLVTTEFVRELVKGLGRDTCLEMLPENILARNEF